MIQKEQGLSSRGSSGAASSNAGGLRQAATRQAVWKVARSTQGIGEHRDVRRKVRRAHL